MYKEVNSEAIGYTFSKHISDNSLNRESFIFQEKQNVEAVQTHWSKRMLVLEEKKCTKHLTYTWITTVKKS